MLLLRAFYQRSGHMKDENNLSMRESIEKCVWKTNEFNKPNRDALKIDSEVATDDDKGEFLEILKQGVVAKHFKSRYAENYRFSRRRYPLSSNTIPPSSRISPCAS